MVWNFFLIILTFFLAGTNLNLESSAINTSSILQMPSDGFSRTEAIECLKKIVAENTSPLSKVEITCLAASLAVDPEILKDANISDYVN